MNCAVYQKFYWGRVWHTQLKKKMPYPYSLAKIILEGFHYSQCTIHENSRRLSHDNASELVTIQFRS